MVTLTHRVKVKYPQNRVKCKIVFFSLKNSKNRYVHVCHCISGVSNFPPRGVLGGGVTEQLFDENRENSKKNLFFDAEIWR